MLQQRQNRKEESTVLGPASSWCCVDGNSVVQNSQIVMCLDYDVSGGSAFKIIKFYGNGLQLQIHKFYENYFYETLGIISL